HNPLPSSPYLQSPPHILVFQLPSASVHSRLHIVRVTQNPQTLADDNGSDPAVWSEFERSFSETQRCWISERL
ncbi:hypothetical protein Droror1_Dr00027725, partial [Drosera rotundifolia]